MSELTGYDISRAWFNFCFDNPELVTPNHSALLFFAIEHCNRLGWKQKFGFPTTMAKDAIGIRSYNTYINTLNDLVEFGFIKMIEKSKNQYSSNIIALSKNDKARNKALDKAMIKHVTKHPLKQGESINESISSINKPITNNIEPITNNINIQKQELKIIDSETKPSPHEKPKFYIGHFPKFVTPSWWVIQNLQIQVEQIRLTFKFTDLEWQDLLVKFDVNNMGDSFQDDQHISKSFKKHCTTRYQELQGNFKHNLNGKPKGTQAGNLDSGGRKDFGYNSFEKKI